MISVNPTATEANATNPKDKPRPIVYKTTTQKHPIKDWKPKFQAFTKTRSSARDCLGSCISSTERASGAQGKRSPGKERIDGN